MSSILKVDTIQDIDGNNIINESSDTITIGASGDTITIPSGATISNLGTATGFGGVNTPAFEAFLSANQTVSSDTATKIQFDTERFDINSNYDNSTNYRFTPTIAGKYFIYSILRAGPSSGLSALVKMNINIRLNGSDYSGGNIDFRNNNGTTASNIVNATISLNGTTDFIEIFGITHVSSGTPIFYPNNTLFGAYKLIE